MSGTMGRQDFLRSSTQAGGVLSLGQARTAAGLGYQEETMRTTGSVRPDTRHLFNGIYEGPELDHIAFPLGGMGHSHLSFTSFDLPPVVPPAQKHIREAGMQTRIKAEIIRLAGPTSAAIAYKA